MTNPISKHRFHAFQNQSGRCYYCSSVMWLTGKNNFASEHAISIAEAEKFKCTAEHLVARSDGGNNSKSNIVAACRFCNEGRHRRKNPPNPDKYRKHVQGRIGKGKWHPKAQHHLLSQSAE